MKEKRKIKRKSYFVDFGIEILKKEGLSGFTARKVADASGYNVASIYTYFKNLDHLENLASIYFINDYIEELTKSSEYFTDALEVYMNMWILFTKHAFQNPDYFYNVFFATVSQYSDVNLWQEYYDMYPERKPKGETVSGMLEIAKTRDREDYIMDMCVRDNIIDKKYIDYIKSVHLGYFKFVLTDIVKNKLYKPNPKLFQKHMIDFIYVFYYYVDDMHKKMLDEMIKFYNIDRDFYANFFDDCKI